MNRWTLSSFKIKKKKEKKKGGRELRTGGNPHYRNVLMTHLVDSF